MKQYLLLTSAFVAGGLLSGVADAACIKTPTCSSLGYESTTSCTGGVKCPFGNAWNCDSVNKITELTNKITELETKVTTVENNSTAGPRCADCKVGDYVCAGQCFSPEQAYYYAGSGASYIEKDRWLNNLCTGFVIEKSNGECRQIPTMYAYEPVKTISNDEFEKDPNTIITKDADGSISTITNQRIQNDCMAIQKIENEFYWPVIDSCVYSLERYGDSAIVTYRLIEVSNDHYDHVFSTKSYRDTSISLHYPTGYSFVVEKTLQNLFRENRLKVLNVTTFK